MKRAMNPRTEARYRAIIARDGTTCHLCGEETILIERSLDHIEPKARGGSDRLANVALAHKSCNGLRGTAPVTIARPIIEWYRAGWLARAEASELLWRARNAVLLERRLRAAGHADAAAGRSQPMTDEFLRGVAARACIRALAHPSTGSG